MSKDANPAEPSSPADRANADSAADGEAKGGPDSGRHESETAVHRQDGPKSGPQKP